jgi:phosphatidylinositol-3-phosphatase
LPLIFIIIGTDKIQARAADDNVQMKKLAVILATILITCVSFASPGPADSNQGQHPPSRTSNLFWPASLPVYDHIVIIVEENKDYDQIIGNHDAAYINTTLKAEGAGFTRMFGEEHFSQGNYFWLFSGDNHTIGFTDKVPSATTTPHYPFTTANLGAQLIEMGLSFKGFSESLPAIGFTGVSSADHLYARKHVPWISFANVPNGDSVATSSNLRFADFPSAPSQYDRLPTVAFVIPNLENDMHNGPVTTSIPAGDRWLKKNIDSYYQWAKGHNSLLILTFDENDDKRGYSGLTNPLVDPSSCVGTGRDRELCLDLQNRIVTIFAGAHIKAGEYPEGKGITHVNILRTIEAMYGLSASGRQQPNAAGGGIADDLIITDIFKTDRKQ